MAHTAVQPSSAMTSRRPATAIVPQSWQQLPGSAIQAAAASDGSIYVLSDQPAGADKYIWHYSGGTWTNLTGMAAQIAVAPNGTLYAVNAGGGVYSYNGSWTALGGGATAVTTASDNSVYVIEPGSGADGTIWHDVAGTWTQVHGTGTVILGSLDSSSHTIPDGTLATGGIYIANSAGNVYYLNTDGSFVAMTGLATAMASAPGGLFALEYPGAASDAIYYYDLDTPGWSQETGAGLALSSNDGDLFVIGSNDGIYETSLTTVPSALVASNPTLQLAGIGATYARNYDITESGGYTEAITGTSTCAGIATISPLSGVGPDLSVNATGVAVGNCTVTYQDVYGQTAAVNVSVTTGSVVIDSTR
jgi:hypothetical protein